MILIDYPFLQQPHGIGIEEMMFLILKIAATGMLADTDSGLIMICPYVGVLFKFCKDFHYSPQN